MRMTSWRIRAAIFLVGFQLIATPSIDLPSSSGQSVGQDWAFPGYDAHNSGFNPQSVLVRDNVEDLRLGWIHQIVERNISLPDSRSAIGIHAPPIVVNGVLYFVTESNRISALNTLNGRELWSFQYDLDMLSEAEHWSRFQTQNSITHYDGKIWMQTNDCNILGFELITGEVEFSLKDTCVDVPGNDGLYVGHYSPIFVKNVLVTRASAGGGGGRGFVSGYDISNGELLWIWFAVPPTGGDANWDFNNAARGNISPFEGDWGTNNLIGGGSIFSLIASDEEHGIIYFPVGSPAMSYDASLRPGPNLFTDSIVALDATSGMMLWYFQTTPHDINGQEPTRSVILIEAEVMGSSKQVVIGITRGEYVYVLDSEDGKLLFEPISFGANKRNIYNTNKGNDANFTLSQRDLNGMTYCPGRFGGSSTVSAFAYNTVFVASQSFCSISFEDKVLFKGKTINGYSLSAAPTSEGASITAIDLHDGTTRWRFELEDRYQGQITVSGGVVYLLDVVGNFYGLNAENGDLLIKIALGGSGDTGVIIAENARGEMMAFVATSGAIVALELPQTSRIANDLASLFVLPLAVAIIIPLMIILAAFGLYLRRNRKGQKL